MRCSHRPVLPSLGEVLSMSEASIEELKELASLVQNAGFSMFKLGWRMESLSERPPESESIRF